jgi:hypothetical protein
VFGIAGQGIANLGYAARNVIPMPAVPGIGAGGVGGASPAGGGFKGGDGAQGVLSAVESF